MRILTALTALLLCAAGQAQTVDICDRTQQVRDALLEAVDADDCAAVDSKGLAGVETLDLRSKRLTALRAGDFNGLASLQHLWLSGNQLATLPDGAFDGLTGLRRLFLDSNPLTTLPDGVFDSLTSLQYLYLGSQLTTLPDGAFDGLTSLVLLALDGNQLTTLPDGVFNRLASLVSLSLSLNQLTTLPDGVFDGLTGLQDLSLGGNPLTTLPDGAFDGLTGLVFLHLANNRLTALPDGAFDGLASLYSLALDGNQLTTLPAGAFDGLASLEALYLEENQLTTLPDGVFDGLTSLWSLYLHDNRLTTLPDGAFDGLASLQRLWLSGNQLATLPDGVFDGLTSLWSLYLHDNRLTALSDGLFGGLASLQLLHLARNRLTALPAGVFDGLTRLQELYLHDNRLTALPAGAFDGFTSLRTLVLRDNELTSLPAGVFDDQTSLGSLDLRDNHLVELTRNDALFAGLPSEVDVLLDGQTAAARLAAAVPLMLSASDSTRQGFVRVVNESGEPGGVRVFAFDDSDHAPDPIGIQLGAGQVVHFNSNDLEDGNAGKGLEGGVGGPVQGDWRLDVESDLAARVLAFVRHGDGFLTAMHDVLPRDADGRLVAHTFNPGSNMNQASKLRLVNTGTNDEYVSIEGVDDRGDVSGAVGLRLDAGESRTLSSSDLETGDWKEWFYDAEGNRRFTGGRLGDGAGKWRLLIGTSGILGVRAAGSSVVGMSLLESAGGQLTNISTMGVATDGDTLTRLAAAVPLMLSAVDSTRQGFVRVVNESGESGSVRVFAFDDGGHAPDPVEIRLGAGRVVHFNSNDLEYGNAGKGVEGGVGGPVQGDWRLDVETGLAVRVLAFVRHGDGFLTAMHDVLPRDAVGRLVAHTFNPGSNMNQASSLRLVNAGENDEHVSIEGVDDQGGSGGPVTLTLPAGESRTLSAFDLENGAQGFAGTLGDGAGKWRLLITAGRSVVGMSLLESASGHLTNISTAGTVD